VHEPLQLGAREVELEVPRFTTDRGEVGEADVGGRGTIVTIPGGLHRQV
jgi:hypothetical protein